MNSYKLRKIKDVIGMTLVVAFLLLLWGAPIGSFLLWILHFFLPDNLMIPIAEVFFKIYPGLLEDGGCMPDYMGGCS